MAQPYPDSFPTLSPIARSGSMALLKTTENSAPMMPITTSPMTSAIRPSLASGTANQSPKQAAMHIRLKPITQGLRGPVPSAREPRIGAEKAMISPAMVWVSPQSSWPLDPSLTTVFTK